MGLRVVDLGIGVKARLRVHFQPLLPSRSRLLGGVGKRFCPEIWLRFPETAWHTQCKNPGAEKQVSQLLLEASPRSL